MDLKGKVHEVTEIMEISSSFKKRELILEYAENPQYPEYLKFEAVQDKCALLDGVAVGSQVEVSFNFRGRPWTDKSGKTAYFNSLQLWKIKSLEEAKGAPVVNTVSHFDIPSGAEAENDLPF
jgi:hypothetical protein